MTKSHSSGDSNPPQSGAEQLLEKGDFRLPGHFGPGEHEVLAQKCGVVELVQNRFLRASGSDTQAFLQGMLTRDLRTMAVGEAGETLHLEANGKTVALLYLYRESDTDWLIETPPDMSESIRQTFDKYIIMEDVALMPLDTHYAFSLQGPESSDHRQALGEENPEWIWIPHDRCGHGGFDVLCPVEEAGEAMTRLVDAGLRPIGLNALNFARIEALRPWFGQDIAVGENPLVYGHGDRIARDKGCYLGQETVAKTRDRGRPPRLLVQVECTDPTADRLPHLPNDVTRDGASVGQLTSWSISPEGTRVLGLATLKFSSAETDAALLDGAGTEWKVRRVVSYKS
ncbi:GCV-T domain-containing protein [Sulfidibacter corallicola]|uniref:GCVT N-terminal domain-containing protein n=1 Tax=Sulfidibacter corallicola TaxID=2818388 RepID=A0A8A4TSU6_SULCO|nr:hypothetical protein [Sulfidibacter corallicola]QTD53029.1 hypothetical protein J3U87_11250 [Sulfidibacter corallicola]